MPPVVGVLPDATANDIEASPAAWCRICLASDCTRGKFPAYRYLHGRYPFVEPGYWQFLRSTRCKGTQQFVHRTCLDHWRAVKEGTAFSHCTTCKAQFHLRVEFLEDDMCCGMKFQLFVAGDVFLAIQAAIAGVAYLLDRDGKFRNHFAHILLKHPVFFYYCTGVMVFFALVGLSGLLLHFSSDNSDPSCLAGCSYGCQLDCFAASGEASCLVLAIVVLVLFDIPGIINGFIAGTIAFQKIVQRHYHILTKKELTKVYVVEDLQGSYTTPPKMNPEHEQRLKMFAAHVAAATTYICLHLLPMHQEH